MRRFYVLDGYHADKPPCAVMSYDNQARELRFSISPNAGEDDVPMLLAPFVRRGQLEVGPEWANRWVEDRVAPAGRQNIGEVLRAHGLDEYDPFALLVDNAGRSAQDDFYLFEIDVTAAGLRRTPAALELGRALREARRERGVSQEALARRSGVQQSLISRIERGRANPTLATLDALAQALGTRLEARFALAE